MAATPTVDLSTAAQDEIVLRGGNLHDQRAQQVVRTQYARPNQHYPDLQVGLSCLFRPGASLDELAIEGNYPNPNLSVTTVHRLTTELAKIQCTLALYVTPVPHFPDHHTLVFFRTTKVEKTLEDDVLDALVRAMTIVKNLHRKQ
jgi:hypothetical protein